MMPTVDRRTFVAQLSVFGLGGAFADALWARWDQERITAEMLKDAEAVAGLEFSDEERELMLSGLERNLEAYERLREIVIPNAVPPAIQFDPRLPHMAPPGDGADGGGGPVTAADVTPDPARRFGRIRPSPQGAVRRPADLERLAFWPVARLAELVRTGQVSSEELTEMYLDRLDRYGPVLEAVVTRTDDLALRQARRADAELKAGRYRGPLHGIPWGAKDLLATRGYRTTWGAKPYEEQVIDEDATVVRRLEEAGAVLLAKLTLGALAMGDVWFGGRTRNPWDLEQGSSGSSAGPAAATVAGLVGFGIGTETLGSIVSPSTRTGATGLRPTFGRVSRHGAMALSWSMDKIGPICRSAEDCALVFGAIHGADGRDPTARTVPFEWDGGAGLRGLRVGYLRAAFTREPEELEGEQGERARQAMALENASLERLREVARAEGVEPVPIDLPDDLPVNALRIILTAEAGAAFDELTRGGRDDLLARQGRGAWPNTFREARMIPAVEYIQANRVRTMLMAQMERALADVDVFITPSYALNVLLVTNLTGHPAVVVPNGMIDGHPTGISFVGNLWKDAETLRVAKAYQDATEFHLEAPPRFR
ncbi:MAG TPA: amidase [Longimicrobiales bacterium]|nr:amidase [Longimicrobiales bacterium]